LETGEEDKRSAQPKGSGLTLALQNGRIIAGYTFYITTAKSLDFWSRFREMAAISLAVAVLSFGIGWVIRSIFGVEL
jgi:hypothetical protein